MPSPVIDTERLILDALVAADAPAFFAYRSLPDVSRYQHYAPRVDAWMLYDNSGLTPSLQDWSEKP